MKRRWDLKHFPVALAEHVAADAELAARGGKCDSVLTWIVRLARQQGDWPEVANPPADRWIHPDIDPRTDPNGMGFEFAREEGLVWVIWQNPSPSCAMPLNSDHAMCFSFPDDGTIWRIIQRHAVPASGMAA